jgi:ubiquinone/menaquinone biosynthesis C-methylase UbiE
MTSLSRAFGRMVERVSMKRAHQLVQPVLPWLQGGTGNLLDFGCGLAHVACVIQQETGREITGLDVRRFPYTCREVPVEVFNGRSIPFPDGAFETTVIFTVLHHTPDPRESLKEVLRVTRRSVLLCEDLLLNRRQVLTETIKDTIANGFLPHMTLQYRTEAEWEQMFPQLGLTIREKKYHSSNFIFHFKHVSWLLEKNSL